MVAPQYGVWSGHMPTTAPMTKIALVAATTKTVMQIRANASSSFSVKRWGVSFDASSAATPVQCELIETGTVAATVTAYVSADIYPYNNANAEANILNLSNSGFNATAEGTVTTSRIGDYQLIAPTNQFLYDWVLGSEFQVSAGNVLRVRLTSPTAVNCVAYVIYEQ